MQRSITKSSLCSLRNGKTVIIDTAHSASFNRSYNCYEDLLIKRDLALFCEVPNVLTNRSAGDFNRDEFLTAFLFCDLRHAGGGWASSMAVLDSPLI